MQLTKLIKSPPDSRDYQYASSVESLPRKVDLRPYVYEIEDQSTVGSCTANATCSALELMGKRAEKSCDLSRLFMYYETRLMENRIGQDGAALRDALKSANKAGVPLESIWPYDISKVDAKPSQESYDDASKHLLTRYESVPIDGDSVFKSIQNIKSALTEGLPVIVAMPLSSSIYQISGPLSQHNYLPVSEKYPFIGNHAFYIVGYDDDLNGGVWICANSWGSTWGDNGYFALGQTLSNGLMEAWVVRGFNGIEIVKPEPAPSPAPVPEPIPAPPPQPEPPKPDPAPEPPKPEPQPAPQPEKSSNAAVFIGVALIAIAIATKAFGFW